MSTGPSGTKFKEDNVLSTHIHAAHAADPQAPLMAVAGDTTSSDAMLATVIESLTSDKAEDIVQIDLRGKTEIGDYMVVCSGRSTRQVAAISEKLAQVVKDTFGLSPKIEGKDTGDWVLIDTGDVIVHVFRPEVREFYQLEKMWLEGGETTTPTS